MSAKKKDRVSYNRWKAKKFLFPRTNSFSAMSEFVRTLHKELKKVNREDIAKDVKEKKRSIKYKLPKQRRFENDRISNIILLNHTRDKLQKEGLLSEDLKFKLDKNFNVRIRK